MNCHCEALYFAKFARQASWSAAARAKLGPERYSIGHGKAMIPLMSLDAMTNQ